MSIPLNQALDIPIHSGLLHHFSFNDVSHPTGQDWVDHVAAYGGTPVWFTGGGTPSIVAGLNGNAVRLQSASLEYLAESNALMAQGSTGPIGSGDWTLAGWYKLRSLASIQDLWWRWDTSLGQREMVCNFNSTAQALRFLGSSDGTSLDIDVYHLPTSGNIPQDDWVFVVARRNGTSFDFIVNQSGVSSQPIASTYSFHPSTSDMLIGAAEDAGSTSRYADIDIDSFSFWNRALADTELDWLYNAGAGREYPYNNSGRNTRSIGSGVRTVYRMGVGAGQRCFDANPAHRRDATNVNGPTPVVGAVGSGNYFNGTSQYYQLNDTYAADWEIGNRAWTAACRFKCTNASSNPMLIAKNDETGIPGGTEWNIQIIGNQAWDYVSMRVGHPSIAQTHSVNGSGLTVSPTGFDEDVFRSVVWGFEPGSGIFIQVDDGVRNYNSDIAATGTNVGTAPFTIGRRGYNPAPLYFQGVIDSVHLWHKVLTEEEARYFNTGE